jgi:hypothetical protein
MIKERITTFAVCDKFKINFLRGVELNNPMEVEVVASFNSELRNDSFSHEFGTCFLQDYYKKVGDFTSVKIYGPFKDWKTGLPILIDPLDLDPLELSDILSDLNKKTEE